MNKLLAIAYKEIRTRFTDRNLLLIMLAAPLAISTIIGLAFGGLGRTTSPIRDIPVAVINYDQPSVNGTSFGVMLSGLLTEGQLPAGTNSSLTACPQAAATSSDGSAVGGMTLAELINGSAFDETLVHRLINDKTIETPAAPIGSPQYIIAAARAAVDKGVYAAVVIIPADFSAALASLADQRLPPTTTVHRGIWQRRSGTFSWDRA